MMAQTTLPLVSMEQLHDLEDSLGGEPALCRGFVTNYIGMWTGRFQKLTTAIGAEDFNAAMDAALSLHTSSRMVGAELLSEQSGDLIMVLRRGCFAGAAFALLSLGECGERTMTELMESYVRPGPLRPGGLGLLLPH